MLWGKSRAKSHGCVALASGNTEELANKICHPERSRGTPLHIERRFPGSLDFARDDNDDPPFSTSILASLRAANVTEERLT